jgi:18S rRNA (guanine1575-N7)-methyltransferase
MSRPELIAAPDVFYDETEAKKYGYKYVSSLLTPLVPRFSYHCFTRLFLTCAAHLPPILHSLFFSTRMLRIQTEMTERALQLLRLSADRPSYVLDIGTGSGLSGEVLTEHGHSWVGVDISPSMLGVALEREVEGDLLCADMGQGMNFRPSTFDGCISISAIQWLCNADEADHIPQRRLKRFFTSLYRVLVKGARAVMQFYPRDADQVAMITRAALTAGFSGGVIIDYPNSTKAKKYYLCLLAGEPDNKATMALPRALGTDQIGEPSSIEVLSSIEAGARRLNHKRDRGAETRKDYIMRKKERQRRQGREVRPDTKYTGKSRGPKF